MNLFASDVHLSPSDPPSRVQVFCRFLAERAAKAEALYVLGDLFDYWTGSSMLKERGLQPLFEAMRTLTHGGTSIHLLPGNRDFLVGRYEAERMGARVTREETLEVELDGIRLFLTHGDIFCTFDTAYQQMKRVLRNPITMSLIRLVPSPGRNALARFLRRHSTKAKRRKSTRETSLDIECVQNAITKGFNAVICGHVHHAQDQELPQGGRLITLSAWHESGGTYAELKGRQLSLKRFCRD